jgi:hypothetical protein
MRMSEGGYPSWDDARRRVQSKTVGARDHLAKRPDDPVVPDNLGEAEHEDDLGAARGMLIGFGIAVAFWAGVAVGMMIWQVVA